MSSVFTRLVELNFTEIIQDFIGKEKSKEVVMSNKKQSSVDFIFNAFNLLSDSDFKAWMLNNHGVIKAMHQKEHGETWDIAMEQYCKRGGNVSRAWEDFDEYYNKQFGGNNE